MVGETWLTKDEREQLLPSPPPPDFVAIRGKEDVVFLLFTTKVERYSLTLD